MTNLGPRTDRMLERLLGHINDIANSWTQEALIELKAELDAAPQRYLGNELRRMLQKEVNNAAGFGEERDDLSYLDEPANV